MGGYKCEHVVEVHIRVSFQITYLIRLQYVQNNYYACLMKKVLKGKLCRPKFQQDKMLTILLTIHYAHVPACPFHPSQLQYWQTKTHLLYQHQHLPRHPQEFCNKYKYIEVLNVVIAVSDLTYLKVFQSLMPNNITSSYRNLFSSNYKFPNSVKLKYADCFILVHDCP